MIQCIIRELGQYRREDMGRLNSMYTYEYDIASDICKRSTTLPGFTGTLKPKSFAFQLSRNRFQLLKIATIMVRYHTSIRKYCSKPPGIRPHLFPELGLPRLKTNGISLNHQAW